MRKQSEEQKQRHTRSTVRNHAKLLRRKKKLKERAQKGE